MQEEGRLEVAPALAAGDELARQLVRACGAEHGAAWAKFAQRGGWGEGACGVAGEGGTSMMLPMESRTRSAMSFAAGLASRAALPPGDASMSWERGLRMWRGLRLVLTRQAAKVQRTFRDVKEAEHQGQSLAAQVLSEHPPRFLDLIQFKLCQWE
jgi:hypothetical protein